jgi:hypothetical protein
MLQLLAAADPMSAGDVTWTLLEILWSIIVTGWQFIWMVILLIIVLVKAAPAIIIILAFGAILRVLASFGF